MSRESALQSRGYRNKNPGNIDYIPANKWKGQLGIENPPAPGSRARFAVFESHEYGIRALIGLLTTYQNRYNLRTIEGIIKRWAPSTENNTQSYINAVCRQTGFGRKTRLDMRLYEHACPLVEAIITHELGGNPYSGTNTIQKGLELYGVVPGVQQPVTTLADSVGTGTGQAAVGTAAVGLTGLGALEALSTVAPHAGGLTMLVQSLGPWIVGALLVGAALYFLLRRKTKLVQ